LKLVNLIIKKKIQFPIYLVRYNNSIFALKPQIIYVEKEESFKSA